MSCQATIFQNLLLLDGRYYIWICQAIILHITSIIIYMYVYMYVCPECSSNVGKSSLINHLLGNNKIVRTSKTPGCTRNVNFYAFVTQKGIKSTFLVDLPGYGYAKSSKEDREDWVVMIKKYLVARDLSVLRWVGVCWMKWSEVGFRCRSCFFYCYSQFFVCDASGICVLRVICLLTWSICHLLMWCGVAGMLSCHRRAYILIDARRGAADSDGEMMEFMTKAAIPHQVRAEWKKERGREGRGRKKVRERVGAVVWITSADNRRLKLGLERLHSTVCITQKSWP